MNRVPGDKGRFKVFKFIVSHEALTPNPGTCEVAAPDFLAAMKFIMGQMPGVHVMALVSERFEDEEEATS